jgi:hypothetical protein
LLWSVLYEALDPLLLWLLAWSFWVWLGFGMHRELPRDLGPTFGVVAKGYIVRRFAVASPIVECRITLGLANLNGSIDIRLNDKVKLKTLLEDPVASATVDRNPKRYPVVGGASLMHEDGPEGGFVIFEGCGAIKQNDQYLFVELVRFVNTFGPS